MGWFVFLIMIVMAIKKHVSVKLTILMFIVILLFGVTDIVYKPTRISSLLFFKSEGFQSKIHELKIEGGLRFLYNNITIGSKDLINEYLKYFSPQYLIINGDENYRFGYPGMSLITPIEYLLLFIGLYFLFKNREKWRFYILLLLLFSPSSAILSWAGVSLTRSLFILIPIFIISSYGLINLSKQKKNIFFISLVIYFIFLLFNWDFYYNHYPKRAIVLRYWQAGYKELGSYIKENYNNYNKFYITKKNGQPYIFLLFYLQYPPDKYQQFAKLSAPDEYGFGQVESFDKFDFSINSTTNTKQTSLIGYPDDFPEEERFTLKKIQVRDETMFLIKEIK